MVKLGDVTVKVNYEMTETSKAVLRNELLNILSEPKVLQELLKLLVQESRRKEVPHDRQLEG